MKAFTIKTEISYAELEKLTKILNDKRNTDNAGPIPKIAIKKTSYMPNPDSSVDGPYFLDITLSIGMTTPVELVDQLFALIKA